MLRLVQIETGDRELLASIDAAMAHSVQRSGEWIACRPGCTQCCYGPFAITQLDAIRLRAGLGALELRDPDCAARVRRRAEGYLAQIGPDWAGNATTGELRDEGALPEWMDELACPALDPQTGLCDLYDVRPLTCRTFGPAVRIADGAIGACELCYAGATEEQIAACAVDIDPEGREEQLLDALGARGNTIVAYALTAKSV